MDQFKAILDWKICGAAEGNWKRFTLLFALYHKEIAASTVTQPENSLISDSIYF